MDETDDSGGFPLSPIEEFERKENVELREQIANLNWKNHHEYFDGIRRIAARLDAKIMVYEENIHFARMKLPEELKKLQDLKTQLAETREQLVDNARIYGEAREAILGRMEKECPDVLAKIKIIMGKRIEYWTLLFHKKLRDLSDEVLISLESQDYEQLIKKHVQLVMLTRDEAFIYCSEDQVAEFDDQVEDKLVSLNSKVYSELTKEFQTVTERIRFPFETSVDFAFVQPDLEKMAQILDCLHEIKPRCGDDQSGFTILELLFGMFEKRFRFHFYGDRATNSPDKPQWFFTQVISWMGSNAQFFSDYVQRIMNKTNSEVFVRGEFQKRLVNLAIEKVETMLDSDAFLQRYVLFANLIDETVIFEADLNSFGYPQDFPRVFSLFCRRDIMNAWLRLERETTAKAIDSLIIQENAFQNRHREASDVDEYLTSDFVDSFVSMMQAMFHRYRHVPDLDVQAQFFKLQLMIFDEFRTRLVQILDQAKSPWTQPYPQILNALWYIAVILGEWSDLSEFIRIQNHIDSRKKIRGAFDESKKMYDHVWIQRVTALVNAFGQMISADIEEYGQQKWFAVTNQKPNDVTPSICSFLRRIRDLIGKISASISANSIKKVYEMTSRMVAIVLMDDIVAKTRFNWQGAAQMLYDIETCVIPLLKALYDRPNARLHHSFDIIYDFKWVELLNSLRLLALKEGTAILLKDEICKIPEEMVEEKLADLGIQSLTQQAVLDRFNQRCDMYDISAR